MNLKKEIDPLGYSDPVLGLCQTSVLVCISVLVLFHGKCLLNLLEWVTLILLFDICTNAHYFLNTFVMHYQK